MKKKESEILKILETIQGNGNFVSTGTEAAIIPGLTIAGIEELGFPLSNNSVREIIKVAEKAPFGRGSKTITDTTVRSAWEIDASKISFNNKEWSEFISKITQKAKIGLGLDERKVKSSLYKLLVYQEGDFFVMHKDSEKEKNMFGTLVVNLPTMHTGGEFIIRFDNREEIIDFSQSDLYQIPYIAFFADCDHQVKPVKSGYRVCLIYNLIYLNDSEHINIHLSEKVKKISELLQEMEKNNDCIFPKIIFLDHDYTPANFSFSHLKLHDIPRTQVLCEAAEKAGFFAKTGLLTHYKSGDWESEGGYYDRRYGYDDDEDEDEDDIKNGSMGEIFEEYEHIEHWIAGTFPDLGDFVIENENIIGENIIGEGEPHHYEYEGYTGNAGMTMEYWYYYGCIVLWPKAKTLDILKTLNISVNLKWLKYYTELNNNNDTSSKNIIRQILLNIAGSDKFYKVADTNPVAQALIYLNDEEFIKNSCSNLLIECFSMIDENNWEQLLNKYNPEIFEQIFGDTKIINDYFSIYRLFSILDKIPADNKHLASFIQNQTDKIPQYIGNINFKQNKDSDYNYNTHIHNKQSRKEIIMNIFYKIISFGTVRKNDDKWITEIVDTLTQNQERKYVNEVLITVLKNSKEKGKLYDLLYEKCLKNLSDRVNNKPQPLPDWKREVPKSGNFTEQWKIIKDFLESPVQKTFEYKRLQEIRRQMEYAILNSEIDLEFTTIKKGSPHTMLITKNNANYQRELKDWKEDADLLKSLNSES